MRLGEIVVEQGLSSEADVARGLARATESGQRLGAALIELGLCDADGIATALATQHGVPAARDKHLAAIAPETRALLSSASSERYCAVPIAVAVGAAPSLVVAMRDPGDADAIAAIARETGYAIRPAAASERRIRAALGVSPIGAVVRPAALELAVAPRTRPASTAPPRADQVAPRTRPASTAPPDGNRLGSAAARLAAANAANEPAPAPRSFPFGPLLALVVVIVGGVFAFRWWRGNSAQDVQGAYTSGYLDLSMQLPPGVWHLDPAYQSEQSGGSSEVRQEVLAIGPQGSPERMLVVGHGRMETPLPTVIDDASFRSIMEMIGRGVPSYTARVGVSLGNVVCDVSSVRPRTGVCRAEGGRGAMAYGAVIYLWFASIEDIVIVIYMEQGSLTREAEVEALLRSVTLL